MYSRFKIVLDSNTNKDLLEKFMDSFNAMTQAEKQSAPTVVQGRS